MGNVLPFQCVGMQHSDVVLAGLVSHTIMRQVCLYLDVQESFKIRHLFSFFSSIFVFIFFGVSSHHKPNWPVKLMLKSTKQSLFFPLYVKTLLHKVLSTILAGSTDGRHGTYQDYWSNFQEMPLSKHEGRARKKCPGMCIPEGTFRTVRPRLCRTAGMIKTWFGWRREKKKGAM